MKRAVKVGNWGKIEYAKEKGNGKETTNWLCQGQLVLLVLVIGNRQTTVQSTNAKAAENNGFNVKMDTLKVTDNRLAE